MFHRWYAGSSYAPGTPEPKTSTKLSVDTKKLVRHCHEMCKYFLDHYLHIINSLTTKKQTIKFLSADVQKNVKSNLYHSENSKTRGQTV